MENHFRVSRNRVRVSRNRVRLSRNRVRVSRNWTVSTIEESPILYKESPTGFLNHHTRKFILPTNNSTTNLSIFLNFTRKTSKNPQQIIKKIQEIVRNYKRSYPQYFFFYSHKSLGVRNQSPKTTFKNKFLILTYKERMVSEYP